MIQSVILVLCVTANLKLFTQNYSFYAYGQFRYADELRKSKYFDQFENKRVRLGMNGEFNSSIDYKLEYDLVKSPVLMQAFLDYKLSDVVIFRAGQFKFPFGLEGFVSSTKYQFLTPSNMSESLIESLGRIGESYRDIGVSVYGIHPFDFVNFNYHLSVINGNGIKNNKNNKNFLDLVGKISLDIEKQYEIGYSHYRGHSQFFSSEEDYDEIGHNFYMMARYETFLEFQSEYTELLFDNTNVYNGFYTMFLTYLNEKVQLGIRYGETSYSVYKHIPERSLVLNYIPETNLKISMEYDRKHLNLKRFIKDGSDFSDTETLIFQVQISFK